MQTTIIKDYYISETLITKIENLNNLEDVLCLFLLHKILIYLIKDCFTWYTTKIVKKITAKLKTSKIQIANFKKSKNT